MKTGILARGFELTAALRAYAERRLGAALGRYRDAVRSANVRLSDLNGPRGGIDKACVIEVYGPGLVAVVVRERDADLYVAIDRAAERVDRAVARRIARRHRFERAGVAP